MTPRESAKERTSRLAWLMVELDNEIQRATEANAPDWAKWLTTKRSAMQHRRSLLLRQLWLTRRKEARREARRQATL